jgi:hypothetical protein
MDYITAISKFCLMMEAQPECLLDESTERNYDFQMTGEDDDDGVSYEFQNKQGQTIFVEIQPVSKYSVWSYNPNKQEPKEVTFSTEFGDTKELTGSGDAISVITTVAYIIIDYMKEWAKRNDVPAYKNQIVYTGTTKNSYRDADGKRARLYKKIFSKIILKEFPQMHITRWDRIFSIEEK